MELIRVIVVLILLGRAIYTDIQKGIIENTWMLFGLLSGCLWSGLVGKWNGLLLSLKMVGISFVVLFLLFLIRGLGAGDIKLICVIAAFFQKDILEIVMVAFIVAAIFSITKMLLRIMGRQTAYVIGETINFSIPIGIGTVFAMLS